MSSYQQGSNGGAYQPIEGGPKGGISKKLICGAAVVVILGIAGFFLTSKPGAATDAAMAKANVPTAKDGKIKLFDDQSK